MSIKEKIQKLVEQTVDSLEKEIGAVQQQLVSVKDEYLAVIRNLSELEKQAKLVSDWSDEVRAAVSKDQSTLEAEQAEFNSTRDAFLSTYEQQSAQYESLKRQISILDREIDDKSKLASSLTDLLNQKELALGELDNITNDYREKLTLVKELNTSIEKLTESKAKAEENFREVNKDIIAQLEEKKTLLRAEDERLTKKAAELNTKESDLRTVEQRWKKIYETKGVGFKI
jgi:chromosome segregation ATPase